VRVLVVTTDFPPYSSGGGGQNIMLSDVSSLRSSGAVVTVVCGWSKKPVGSIVDGVEIIRVNFPRIPPHSLWFQLANRDLIQRLAKGVDIVYAYSWSCSLLINSLTSLGVPVVVRLAGSPISNIVSFTKVRLSDRDLKDFLFFFGLGPLYAYLLRKELRDCSHLLLDSQHMVSTLEKQFGVPVLGKSTVIRTNCAYFASALDSSQMAKKWIVYVGRLVSTKGVMDLLRAFSFFSSQSGNSQWKLIMVGEGPLKNKLLKETRRLGCVTRVSLLGRLQREGVREILEQSYMFVLPSYNESASVALCEAMAIGMPVIVPKLPWAIEQTQEYPSKIFFSPGDVGNLAQSILTLSRHHLNPIPRVESAGKSLSDIFRDILSARHNTIARRG
jgi:glycosyltransferase involved in cell wall biosynthesis